MEEFASIAPMDEFESLVSSRTVIVQKSESRNQRNHPADMLPVFVFGKAFLKAIEILFLDS
jgi:hypothetical protein